MATAGQRQGIESARQSTASTRDRSLDNQSTSHRIMVKDEISSG